MSSENRLMVLDDDFILRKLITGVARQCGFEVLGVGETSTFQREFDRFRPEIVTLDLALGEGDGVEVLHYLSGRTHRSKILLVSGFDKRVLASTVRVGESLGLEMLPPLQKPVRADQLSSTLQSLPKRIEPITSEQIVQAVKDGELFINYQPKIDLRSQKTVGAEALVRWYRPGRGVIPPDAFIAIAEQGEAIHPLTEFVFQEAVSALKYWNEKGLKLSIAVNISALSIEDSAFPDRLSELAKEAGINPGQITLEVTETTAMGNVDVVTSVLTRLRIKGFKLSLDDFGTGYSSLVELYRMPFSELKIDKSFVTRLDTDQDAHNIVHAMISLAHNLGLKSVCEGIETRTVMELIKEMNCDIAQGYFYSKPLSFDEFNEWLKR